MLRRTLLSVAQRPLARRALLQQPVRFGSGGGCAGPVGYGSGVRCAPLQECC